MRNSAHMRGVTFGNPIANAVVVVVGVATIVAAVVLGFFALLILSVVMSILAAVVGIRLWWFNRQLRRVQSARGSGRRQPPRADVIEGEYQVLDRGRDRP